jgi:hypothetical protein
MLIYVFLACACISHAINPSSAAQSCQSRNTLPRVEYYISSRFIWFPIAATSSDILQQAQLSHTELQKTANPIPGTVIKSTISNFLNSPCTLHLKIDVTGYASAQQSLTLLNETLGTTDLMMRLANFKLGRKYEPNVHIMLPAKLRAAISVPNRMKRESSRSSARSHVYSQAISKDEAASPHPPQHHLMRRLPPSGYEDVEFESQSSASQHTPPPAGFDYAVECPQSLVQAYSAAQVAEIIGARDGLALMKDCQWCQRVVGEMRGICSQSRDEQVGELARIINGWGWSFGGSTCQEC